MTHEEAAAVLMCRAATAMAKVSGMQAENQQRNVLGESIAYGEAAFDQVILDEQIHYNAVYGLLAEAQG